MIVFDLICDSQHRFEGWFGSADDFERQRTGGLLSCLMCASAAVRKLPTAKIKRGSEPETPATAPAQPPPPTPTPEQQQRMMRALVDKLLQSSENVGDKFPAEARRIHREEAPARAIRGIATKDEAAALLDEGIPVLPLPVPPTGEWH